MKKKFVYASSLCAALALIAFTACKKSSSSSSSTGSISGAMGALTSLSMGNSGSTNLSIRGIKPASCTPGVRNNTPWGMTSASSNPCSAGDSAEQMTGSATITFSSCPTSGYTFAGGITIAVDANHPVIMCMSSGTLVSESGTIDLTNTGSGIQINGNDINQTCTVNIFSSMNYSNSTFSGTVTGTACGQTISSSF